MLLGRLNPLAFALALGVGLMIVYITAPRPRRVLRFPSPLNAGKTVYKDARKGCYVYQPEKVPCDETALVPPSEDEEEAPVVEAAAAAAT